MRLIGDDEKILPGFKTNPKVKTEIKKAQRRLRNAPEFMKKLAQQQFGKLSTAGTYNELVRNYERAKIINDDSAFTKRGYNRFLSDLSSTTKLSKNEINYIFSQINAETMTFIQNSPLKYGTNPQLDYIFESAVQLHDSMQTALMEIAAIQGEMDELTDIIF